MTETRDDNEANEQELLGLELAYPIAVASYESVVKRLDTIDGRIQTILAFVVSVTVAIPSIGGTRGLHFSSYWFILAMLCTVTGLSLGIYARLKGDIQILNPTRLWDGWLHYSERDFKTKLIYCAGVDFESNRSLVHKKWRFMVAVIILFLLEAACLLVWVLSSRP